ncbi:MAG: NDP-sugar synthase [Calditrichia bacterium]
MKNSIPEPGISTAMVLAAGFGTRMKDLTIPLPKPMLPLDSQRIIDVILKKLSFQGFRRVVINLHYFADQLERYVGNGERYGLQVFYSEEETILDTGGGIANAERYFSGETILGVNSDVLSDISFAELFDHHRNFNPLATMAVMPSRNNRDYSLVVYARENHLRGFLKRNQPIPEDYHSGIFTGFQILTPEARHYLKPEPQSIMSAFYRRAMEEGKDIQIYTFNGVWIDLGTKDQYLAFKNSLENHQVNLAPFME